MLFIGHWSKCLLLVLQMKYFHINYFLLGSIHVNSCAANLVFAGYHFSVFILGLPFLSDDMGAVCCMCTWMLSIWFYRIGVDEWLRVPSVQDIFAIGDCSGFLESTGKPVLPALAQVAERQGKYLAELLNSVAKAGGGRANSIKEIALGDPFVYRHLGSMATVGRYKALVDLRQSKEAKGLSLAGFTSWFIWRSAYLTRVVSWRNRFYVAINWFTTFVFGRDISRI